MVAILSFVGWPIELALKSAGVDLNSSLVTLGMMVLYLAVYLGLVFFLTVKPGHLTWREIAFPTRFAPNANDWTADPTAYPRFLRPFQGRARRIAGDVLLALALLIPTYILSDIMDAGVLTILGLNPRDLPTDTGASPTSPLDFLILLFAISVLVPIGEETFFRGFSANAWARSLPRGTALLRITLFFAFVHILNTSATGDTTWKIAILNVAARIPAALCLSWLYMRRHSIVASATLHGLFNGTILLLAALVS